MSTDPMPAHSPKPSHAQPSDAQRNGSMSRIVIGLAVLLVGGYFAYRWWGASSANASANQPSTQPARAVPVVVAHARRRDLPIYIDGLGTVTALNTVTVRPRVDGQIVKIHYTEGQFVKENEVLVEIDPRPYQVQLEQTEGQLAKDAALLKNAKVDLDRYQTAREAISQQQLATAESLVAQYEGSLKTDQAQIDSAKLQLTYATVTAPLSGRIGLRLVDQGNIVHANDATGLAVITQIQPLSIVFSLPEGNLLQILKAFKADPNLSVEAYSRDMKTKIATGKLLAIDNQIDPATGTAKFKSIFDNADLTLFPNQFVNVRLLVDTLKGAIVVSSAAIQQSPQGTFVYVVNPDTQTVENRSVTLGPTEGDYTVIESGLAEGETVVTDGVDKLKPGMLITARSDKPNGGASTRSSK
ncbi:MdtA/MuxA family multidrug efflux RND transporter periplasmic adaptor subunit [soil metagenome]